MKGLARVVVVVVMMMMMMMMMMMLIAITINENQAWTPYHIFSGGCSFAKEFIPLSPDRQGIPALYDAQ
jgi:hypothetical protein